MDDEGVRAFCERLRPRLVGALGLHTGDRGVAEELSQGALARPWARWPKVRDMDRPEAWAYRPARRPAT
jgi:DNA-directed RNA polymerase specialized sigma24 family protein